MNGDTQSAPVVPGQTTGTTPPFQPQGAAGGVDEQTRQILEMLKRVVSQRKFAGQARPSPVPGLSDPRGAREIGMNTAWPHAWGFERFAAGLQSNIGNAVAMHKEAQIQKAEATYDYYGNLVNNLLTAQSSGNEGAVKEAQQKLDNFYKDKGNISALHKAAKALNQSWLDPEKTDAWGTAMQRTMAKQKQKDQARSGIQNLFRRVMGMGRQQQPQLSQDESVQAGRQIQEKVPSTGTGADLKTLELQEKVLHDRAEEARMLKQQDAEEAYRKAELEMQRDRLTQQDRLRQQEMKIESGRLEEERRSHRATESLKRQELFLADGSKADDATTALVKKIADYEIDPKSLSTRGGHRERILSLVAQYDPSYDQTQYSAIQSMRKDFASGKSAGNVRSLNTAIGHLSTLKGAGDELRNGNIQLWNLIRNKTLTGTGDPRVTKFNAAANAVESEMASVFKGTGATDQEIKAWREQLSSAQSPAQIHTAIDTLLGLMASRMEAVDDQRRKAKMKPEQYRILDDESRKILKKLGGDSATRMLASEMKDVAGEAGDDTVMVISPDGKRGTIPRANLQKALQRGYKQAQ